jgi:large subunit ribosomal protein L15e
MTKGLYQHIRSTWKREKTGARSLMRTSMIKWRKEPRFKRVDKPTKLDKARGLGYKAKKGFVLVRARIGRGGRRRPLYGRGGRKPSKTGLVKYTTEKSLRKITEQRVQKKYLNLEVLGSYYLCEDGISKWFEVILVDPNNPEIRKDKHVKWITEKQHRRRVLRGLP